MTKNVASFHSRDQYKYNVNMSISSGFLCRKSRGVISQNILVVPILDKIWKNAYFSNSYIVNSENIGSARALWVHY